MYGRYRPVAILLLLVISVSFSLSGQTPTDEPWSVWLYTLGDQSGLTQPQPQLVRVYADGTTEEFIPAIPPGNAMSEPAFSDTGNWIAYCAPDPVTMILTLSALDLTNGADGLAQARGIAFPIAYTLERAWVCNAIAFSDDETQLALIVTNNVTDSTIPAWEVLIFNLITGAVEKRLPADTFALTVPTDSQNPLPTPELCLYLDNRTVVFRLLPAYVNPGSQPLASAYSWNADTDALTPYPLCDAVFLNIAAVVAVTGQIRYEYVWVLGADNSFPTTEVMYSDGVSGSAYPIYAHPDGLAWAKFADGGRHIVAQVSYGARVAIDRSGAQTTLPENTNIGTITGTGDGFVALEIDSLSWAAQLVYYRFAPDGRTVEPTTLWQDDPGRYWSLVWSTPMQLAADLQPFPPIQP